MGMLSTGITAAGGLAGNAVGSVGSMIESAGRSAGDCKYQYLSRSTTNDIR